MINWLQSYHSVNEIGQIITFMEYGKNTIILY
jgi:hypothetical protein